MLTRAHMQDRKKARYSKLRQMIEAAEQRSDWTGEPRTDVVMRIDLSDTYVLARPTTDNAAPPDLASVLRNHFSADLIRANTIHEDEVVENGGEEGGAPAAPAAATAGADADAASAKQ